MLLLAAVLLLFSSCKGGFTDVTGCFNADTLTLKFGETVMRLTFGEDGAECEFLQPETLCGLKLSGGDASYMGIEKELPPTAYEAVTSAVNAVKLFRSEKSYTSSREGDILICRFALDESEYSVYYDTRTGVTDGFSDGARRYEIIRENR